MFYKTQIEVADAIIKAIETFWSGNIDYLELEGMVEKLIDYNDELIFSGADYSFAFRKRLGKKRLRIVDKIMNKKDRG